MSFTPTNLGVAAIALAGMVYAPYRVIRGVRATGGVGAYLATEPWWMKLLLAIGCLVAALQVLFLLGSVIAGGVSLLRKRGDTAAS